MSTGSDAEWILSRKIAVKSLARHFAPWKKRFFVLDRANGLLGVRSSNDTMVVINLYSPDFLVLRHEYSVDDKNSITVKYREEDSTTVKEIVMKFETAEQLDHWEKALHSAAEDVKAVTATSTRALFHSFIDYINEQSQVRKIVDSESQYEAQYYAEGEMESENTGFMASSMVSEAEREQFIAEHSRYLDDTHSPPVPASVATGVDEEVAAKIRIKPLSIPRMRILLVAVGTRGDMQPFVQLGLRLQRDGHRVRLATHACFRDYVQGKGLEFYPLAGDPLKLSEFMVKTQGFVIPTTPELLMQAPIYHAMVVDMMYSCWGACVDPDPADPEQKKFVADAIISNPVSYAHVHCAEALGIPLHLMFPQPWTPTKAFPHPLSCLSYQQGWSAENYISYQLVDSMLWMSFERQINAFRTTILGLEPLRVGNGGWNHLNTMKVPFVKMWSPSFVPKPKDWPSYVDVVGTFFDAAAPAPVVNNNHVQSGEVRMSVARDKKHKNKRNEGHQEDVQETNEGTTVHKHVAVTSSTKTHSTQGTETKPGQTITTTKTVRSEVSVTASASVPAQAPSTAPSGPPMSPIVESSFTPPPALLNFLDSGDAPVFVGFGSMVVKDLEALISLFLEGAALAGVRVIVQVGWSEITQERFLDLALQAQLKASIVRETESMNDNLLSSVIFPRQNHKHNTQRGDNHKGVTSGVADLSLSCRSVESVEDDGHDGHDGHDESTLDGERLFSVSTRESESALAVSSISASGGHSGLRDAYNNGTLDAEFDTSPIPSPPRTVSTEGGHRSSESNLSGSLSGSTGIGNWLLGAAMNISKTFSQPSTSAKGNSTPNSDSNSNQNQKPPSRSAPHSHSNAPQHTKHATHPFPHHNKHDLTAEDPLAQSDISACWDEVERDHTWSATKDAMFLGPCPHDWLFQRVAGVVHHGGAGTTAAGLRYGCPSWICPFFGDQHFWGEMVHRRKVGPKPCPIGALTLPIVAESLALLLDDETIAHAAALAAQMAAEDGVEGACQAFYKHLPVENMICDVSLFRGEYRLAQVYCQDCGFKMCNEVAQYLHNEPSLHLQQHTLLPCCYKDWSRPPPASAAEGLIQGLGGLVHEIKEGVSDILYDPVHGIYQQGLSGAAAGLSSGLNSLLSRPMAGGSVLLNKVKAGIQASLAANLHYGVEPSAYDPLNADSSYAIVGAKHNKSHGADDAAPLVLNALQANRIRALKMSLPDMPAVYSPKLPHKTLSSLEGQVDDSITPPQASVPTLVVSPVRIKQAEQDKKTSPTAPTSPRGATTVLDSRTPSPLHVSVLRSASLDSSTFYGAPRDVDGAEVDSDGDDSVYDAEADEAMPFLLEPPATTQSTAEKDMEESAARVDLDPSDTPCPSQPLQVARSSSRNSGVQDSLSSTVNHSNDDSIHANSPLPADTPVPSSPGPLAPSPRAVPVKSALKKEQTAHMDEKELTLLEAFRVAQDTQHLFTALGAENGRFLPTKEFGKLMQRAVLRETAVRSIDTLATTDASLPEKKTGSLSAHVTGKHRARVGRDGTPVLNETSINALMQMVAHNKRYMDFVDFSLIYLQLADAQGQV